MTKKQNRKTEFYIQLNQGKYLLKNKQFEHAFYHFENAHILGQKNIYRHTLSHLWMLIFALKTENLKECIGQCFRILASIIFTSFWVPKGNSGGTNISSVKSIPIRKELKKYF